MGSKSSHKAQRKAIRSMQWDAQIERSREIYYQTLSRLARNRQDRRAFATFAQLEGTNARAIRFEIHKAGATVRPNPVLNYLGFVAGATAPLVPRRLFLSTGERVLAGGPAYWNGRRRVYGTARGRLIKRILEHNDVQRDWFADQLAACRRR